MRNKYENTLPVYFPSALYKAMALHCSVAQWQQFWLQQITLFSPCSARDCLTDLYHGRGAISRQAFCRLIENVNAFCQRQDVQFQHLANDACWYSNGKSVLPQTPMSALVKQLQYEVGESGENRCQLDTMLPRYITTIFPHITLTCISTKAQLQNGKLLFTVMDLQRLRHFSDGDCTQYLEPVIKQLLPRHTAQPDPAVQWICDMRHPQQVIGAQTPLRQGSWGCAIEGNLLCKTLPLHHCDTGANLDLSTYCFGRWKVQQATADYTCPQRKKKLIYKGRIYRAPFYVLSIDCFGASTALCFDQLQKPRSQQHVARAHRYHHCLLEKISRNFPETAINWPSEKYELSSSAVTVAKDQQLKPLQITFSQVFSAQRLAAPSSPSVDRKTLCRCKKQLEHFFPDAHVRFSTRGSIVISPGKKIPAS